MASDFASRRRRSRNVAQSVERRDTTAASGRITRGAGSTRKPPRIEEGVRHQAGGEVPRGRPQAADAGTAFEIQEDADVTETDVEIHDRDPPPLPVRLPRGSSRSSSRRLCPCGEDRDAAPRRARRTAPPSAARSVAGVIAGGAGSGAVGRLGRREARARAWRAGTAGGGAAGVGVGAAISPGRSGARRRRRRAPAPL